MNQIRERWHESNERRVLFSERFERFRLTIIN